MARVLWAADRRIWKDNGEPANDGTLAFRLANTATPVTVYSDEALSQSLGASVNIGSDGYLESDITVYGNDNDGYDGVINSTGVNGSAAWTIPDLAFEASSSSDAETDVAIKNLIANGGFVDWSGGTSFTNASGDGDGDEVADGWYFSQSTAAGNVVSRQDAARTGARFGIRLARANGNSITNEQRLWIMVPTDEAYRARGQSITVSFNAHCGANFSAAGASMGVKVATGTSEAEDGDLIATGGFGGHSNIINESQALTTSTARFEFSGSVGASAKEIGLQFSWTPVGTAGANDWLQIEDVQIEIGTVATDFESAPEPIEYLRANLTPGGRAFIASSFTDPNADRLLGWDDSASEVIGFTLPTGLGFSGTGIVLANDLAAVEALSSTGFAVRTASETWAQRSLAQPAAGLTISNSDGVSGNPTFALADDLAALEALSGTSTIYYRSATSTWTAVAYGTGLTFSGGTLSLNSALTDLVGTPLTATELAQLQNINANTLGTTQWAALASATGNFGTAAYVADGTSGNAYGKLNANLTFSGTNTFSALTTVAATLNVNAGGAASGAITFGTGGNAILSATTSATLNINSAGYTNVAVSGVWAFPNASHTINSNVITHAGNIVSQVNAAGAFSLTGALAVAGQITANDGSTAGGVFRLGTGGNGVIAATSGAQLNINGAGYSRVAITGPVTVTSGLTAPEELSSETSGTLTSASANRTVKATGGITINDGVFTANDHITVYNDSDSSITITQDTGMTLRLAGTTTTGNRTLLARGIAVIYFDTNADAAVGGTGVT